MNENNNGFGWGMLQGNFFEHSWFEVELKITLNFLLFHCIQGF
jgi:hypothetical protein